MMLLTGAIAAEPSPVGARLRLTVAERTALQATHRERCNAIAWGSAWGNQDWVFPFSDSSALVLLGCTGGAYNHATLVLLRSPTGQFTVVDLPYLAVETEGRVDGEVTHTKVLEARPDAPRQTVTYPRFYPETGVLEGTVLGRGLGDTRKDIAWRWVQETKTFTLLYWMQDASDDNHFTPSCAFPVKAEGPCPGYPMPSAEAYSSMVYTKSP